MSLLNTSFLIKVNEMEIDTPIEHIITSILGIIAFAGYIYSCYEMHKGSKEPIQFEEEKIKIEI